MKYLIDTHEWIFDYLDCFIALFSVNLVYFRLSTEMISRINKYFEAIQRTSYHVRLSLNITLIQTSKYIETTWQSQKIKFSCFERLFFQINKNFSEMYDMNRNQLRNVGECFKNGYKLHTGFIKTHNFNDDIWKIKLEISSRPKE